MRAMSMRLVTTTLLVAAVFSIEARGADKAAVQQSIAKGAAHIKAHLEDKRGAYKTFAYLTLLKAGEDHASPLMTQGATHVLSKLKDGVYPTPTDGLYEASVDVMFLADLDAEKYRAPIEAISNYISGLQTEAGWWTYDPVHASPICVNGDVSITHYACLGLWAAARAGVKIDPQVWVRVLKWQAACNNKDGGYTYWPETDYGVANGMSSMNMTVNSVGTMYIAMINLEPKRAPKISKDGADLVASKAATPAGGAAPAAPSKKETGALEVVNLDDDEDKNVKALAPGKIPDAAFGSVNTAFHWVSTRYEPENKETPFKAYYYYSLERMAALVNTNTIAGRDWFNECADHLIAAQNADGGWNMTTHGGPENDTAFAVLFLTRSTGKILGRTVLEPPVGGGLLSGGRGLPDDLKEVDASGNVKKKKEKSSLDELLAALQNPDAIDLEEAQAELVQQIQLGDKKALIGQTDRLLELVKVPDPEIRRTAIWAIGRTGNLSLARFAILGLDDPDSGVMTESHLALCWVARKPHAFKLPLDPLDGVAADAGADQKSAAIESWRRQALRLWGEWYLRNRPYDERGDEFETNLRNRLLQLN